jgi:hypothetical protein
LPSVWTWRSASTWGVVAGADVVAVGVGVGVGVESVPEVKEFTGERLYQLLCSLYETKYV